MRILFAIAASFVVSCQAGFATETISIDRWRQKPEWSPDGTKVAVSAGAKALKRGEPLRIDDFSGNSRLYILNAADNSVVSCFDFESHSNEWSPDNRYLLVQSGRYGSVYDATSGKLDAALPAERCSVEPGQKMQDECFAVIVREMAR
jgi:hypothetical protein